jgi:branched-chain amino acid transport system substrate-binding protein
MNIFKMFACLLIVSVIATACTSTEQPVSPTQIPETEDVEVEQPATMEPIIVGMDIPYTGPDALEGENVYKGVVLAVEEINAAGGLLGHKVELVIGDNQCDSAIGVSALRKMIETEKPLITIGSLCSSVSLAVMPILQEFEVASLDVTASNPGITEQAGPAGGNIWKFRMNLNDLLMNEIFGRDVIAKEVERLAILGCNTDYGRGAIEVFQNAIGDKIVAIEYFYYGDADFRSQLTSFKDLNADGLLIVGDSPEAAKIMSQMHELGMKLKIYGRGTVVDNGTLALLTPEILPLFEGAKEVNHWAPNPEAQFLADAYFAKYGETIRRDPGNGYFGMLVIAEAIKNCGVITGDLAVDRACVRDALDVLDIYLTGFGQVKFDDHNQNRYDMYIAGIENGKVVVLQRVPVPSE